MKEKAFKTIFIISLFLISALNQSQTPDFSMIGFATLNGVTTGGEGGQIVTPTTFAELKQYVEAISAPYIIRITKEFNTGVDTWVNADGSIVNSDTTDAIATTFGAVLRVGSNKTLIGIGDQAFFNRIGLVVQCQSNIIIRNIRFTMKDVPATRDGEYKILDTDGVTTIGDPDCIGIQADAESIPEAERISQHIWIDHCEFYNENIDNKDRYDGLLDNKNNVQNMTISWCYFHDHSKAMLSGKGSSDDYNRTITFHHNYFYRIYGSRLPLLRFGQHHYFNNFMEDCEGDGLDLRINTNCYIENNYFKDSKKPVFGKLSENGQGLLVNNIFENCSRLPEGISNINGAKSDPLSSSEEFVRACNFTPDNLYDYASVLTEATDVPNIVKSYSGIGKISDEYTKVIQVSPPKTRIWAGENAIQIETDHEGIITVFKLDGQKKLETEIAKGTTVIPLHDHDIYIIKFQSQSSNYIHKIYW
ncbi:polysaccharide lyase family 1 protein [Saccharicrinis sp. FJH62]|uniref:pectate lyase family protein n=1 Tax=Saccharicrinis sp. FJH62 TaxID=3344657 RepID=UPI0035D52A21